MNSAARGKFISGAKVLAVVQSMSQPKRVYEDKLETGGAGKELSTNNEIQRRFGRVVFWNGVNRNLPHFCRIDHPVCMLSLFSL